MTELEFCKERCEISSPQEIWLKSYIDKGNFIGAGRAFGCRAYMPLVFVDGHYYVIDSQGSLRAASTVDITRFLEKHDEK